MARPFKEGLDYFPLDVDIDQDDKIALIEASHGLVGFAVIVKVLMKIYDNSYFYEWGEKEQLLFSRRVNVNINEVNAVIDDCVKWGIFSKELYETHQILTSAGIQRRYLEATSRRKRVNILTEYLLLDEKEVKSYKNLVIADINSNNDDISTQSKVKESKVKESKEIVEEKEEQQESPPATTTDAIVFYQNNIGMIRPAIAEEMLDWINDFGDQMVIHALNISLERNKPNWGYAKAILKSWHDKGIKTMEQVKAEEVAFQNNQAQRRPFNQSHQPSVPEPDWFRNGEHERKAAEQNGSDSGNMTEEQSKVAQLLQQYQQQAE